MRAKGSGLKRQQMDKQLRNRVHKVATRMGDGTVSGCGDEARHSEETLGRSGWWSGRAVGSGRRVVWVFPLHGPHKTEHVFIKIGWQFHLQGTVMVRCEGFNPCCLL